MSYKDYVTRVLVPGNKSDPTIKRERREIIKTFLDKVSCYPEISQQVHINYRLLKEKTTDSVFPSFIRLIEKTRDLFEFFAKSEKHIAIQDDFHYWNQNGEKEEFGKKFVFDRSLTHLSLFFDENLSEGIVSARTSGGDVVATAQLLGKLLFQAHPGEAVLDDNYYINLTSLD